MKIITNPTKKDLQQRIVNLKFAIDEFEYLAQERNEYLIKYKNGDFWFKFILTGINHPVTVRYLDTDSTIAKEWFGSWGSAYTLYEQWLRRVFSEKENLPYELLQKEQVFSDVIKGISSRFPVVYNQALKAEYEKLDEICGMGYRKAFECLLKDYLVYTEKMTLEEAQKEYRLQNCINRMKEDYIVHKLATYAAHLGNDFSHYARKMIDKEVTDLKQLIAALIDWIDTTESHKLQIKVLSEKSTGLISNFENNK